MELPGKEPPTAEQSPDQAQPARLHWSERPLLLLAAVMGTKLLLPLLAVTASMPFLPFLPQNGGEKTRLILALLSQVVQILMTLAVGFLFLHWLKAARRRHGADCAVDWKAGVPFWVGIPLALGVGVLTYSRYFEYQPFSAVLNFIGTLAYGFTAALLLALLFPVLERRFGILIGALLLCGADVLLAMLTRTALWFLNSALAASRGMAELAPMSAGTLLPYHLRYTTGDAAGASIAVVAWLLSSRRVLGTWLLATGGEGMLTIAVTAIASSVSQSGGLTRGEITVQVHLPFYLAVLALTLLGLAALQRWKSWRDFSGSAKRLADTVITMGEDK